MDDWSSARLCDVGNLFLGMILFFSPWLFGLCLDEWGTGALWVSGGLSICAAVALLVLRKPMPNSARVAVG